MGRKTTLGRAAILAVRGTASRLLTGARAIAAGRRALLDRRRSVVRLDDVRRRLELLVTAVYGRPIPIAAVEPPKRRREPLWDRIVRPRHLRSSAVLPSTDGERIQLPRQLESDDAESALAAYRLLAIEQAERIARGTPAYVEASVSTLERDLYLVREGAEVDAAIARNVPGLRAALAASRASALATRPPLAGLSGVERGVEMLVRGLLAGDAAPDLTSAPPRTGRDPMANPAAMTPAESLAWARARAADVSTLGGRYRGLAPILAWGTVRGPVRPRDVTQLPHAYAPPTMQGGKYGFGRIGRGTGQGGHQASERGTEEGTSDERRSGEALLDPSGTQRTIDGAGGKPTPQPATEAPLDADSDDQEPSEAAKPASDDAGDGLAIGRRAPRPRRRPEAKPEGGATQYPEWDWQAGDYVNGAVVHSRVPDVSDDSWGNAVLARHGPLVRQLRERFERLRARRVRLNQQRDGDELDLAACVRALVDQRSGHPANDRLYLAVRPARRGLAICLLIDISGSTDEWLDLKRRIIDVEKVALLLASEALDALGDLYGILTFSGKGRGNVRMRTIKGFDEANGAVVRARIAALEPEGYTRAGAAIRHATALLERQPAAHRLLLMISDGKPNDVDGYEGLYGVEDTRQAIQESRAQGVYPFCLTIDRQGQEYLGRIFGEAGHTVLRNPSQLPVALVKVVKHLLAS